MIHGKKNYLKKMELRLAVGIRFEDDKDGNRTAKIISGNVQSINNHAKYFVTIITGDIEQRELAKKVRIKILQKALPEGKTLIENIPIEEIQRMIPSGSGDVIG